MVGLEFEQYESMDPSFLISKVQTGGGGIIAWGYFLGTFSKHHSLHEYILLTMSIPV